MMFGTARECYGHSIPAEETMWKDQPVVRERRVSLIFRNPDNID